ncbi:MAG: hypothetical protein K8S99_02885 [Planctomycetes bacterium]|nr:hypothetical protein [Planctomycetota bacterium]
MPTRTAKRPVKARVLRAPIPPTRDPFINTPLIRLSPDPKTGADRFWITTWNSNVGTTAALVDEFGASRIYRLPLPNCGFYSAVQTDDDTLWLCGDLARVVRFTLSTGKLEGFETGAPSSLVFQGMILDKPSGKLFAATFVQGTMATHGFVFDTRARRAVTALKLPTEGHYSRFGFPNGDGTHSLLLHLPGDHVIVWDPRKDAFEGVTLRSEIDLHDRDATSYWLAADERGRRYFPRHGWYNPATRRMENDGPRPEREMTVVARHGGEYIGCNWTPGSIKIAAWDIATGRVRDLCALENSTAHSFNTTRSGKVVAVSVYGVFHRADIKTGALECSRVLDTDSIGSTDCITRIDRDNVLGTPFITQRFWTLNIRTKKGEDLGRVAPGEGEIMRLCVAGGKVYMAAYTGAELMEYDPKKSARYPENPRVVAVPPGGLRPVAIVTDGRVIWYSSSNSYGHLGSVLTRYDTKTGLASYAVNPLGDYQVQSLHLEKKTRTLLVGANMNADCKSATPTQKTGVVGRIGADDLKAVGPTRPAPASAEWVHVLGPVAPGRWLAMIDPPGGRQVYLLRDDLASTEPDEPRPLPAGWQAVYAGKPGYFIIPNGKRLDLWDFRGAEPKLVRVLSPGPWDFRLISVEEGSVIFTTPREVVVLDNVLK